MRHFVLLSALALGMASAQAQSPAVNDGTTRIIVLPSDFAGPKDDLVRRIADMVRDERPNGRLLVFTSKPFRQLADIRRPVGENAANASWVKRKLREQMRPVLQHIATMPTVTPDGPPGNVMLPNLIDELARNVLSILPNQRTDVLVLGSLLYYDARDDRWAMTDRFVPSDGFVSLDAGKAPYGLKGWSKRLDHATLHLCSAGVAGQFVSYEHETAVKRWWSIWAAEQSGRVGTFSDDLAVCFSRFRNGDEGGQPNYKVHRNVKAQMVRMPSPMPAVLPASTSIPGAYFLREDVPISQVPPSTSTGIAWVGLTWRVPCDVDLYTRPNGDSPWLFYGRARSDAGYYNHDWREATSDGQFEFVEYRKPIDLRTTEVAINLFSASLRKGPEGKVRVWFDGRVYEAPFKLEARVGNGGQMPMSGPNWLRVDLRKIVGLPSS